MDVKINFRMTDIVLWSTEKQEIRPSLHKSFSRGWLPCHWKMGARWSNNKIRSAKSGNKNSSSSNVLWFRIVTRQNAEKRDHGSAHVWQHPRANFYEQGRQTWTRAHAYPRAQLECADPDVYRRVGEAWKKHCILIPWPEHNSSQNILDC